MCDSYKKMKAIKRYNQILQQRAIKPYQYIYINFVGSMTLIDFREERYSFMFTDNYTRINETYTAKRKYK